MAFSIAEGDRLATETLLLELEDGEVRPSSSDTLEDSEGGRMAATAAGGSYGRAAGAVSAGESTTLSGVGGKFGRSKFGS